MTASQTSSYSISISIVSYNTCRDLLACIGSIVANPPRRPYTITVVDNGSLDASVVEVGRRYPQVRVIEAGENIGYGRANNLALLGDPGRYFAVLNSDIVLQPGSLDACCDYLDRHHAVGIVGGALINPDGTPQMNWAAGDLTVSSVVYEQYFLAKLLPKSPIFGQYFRSNWHRSDTRALPQVCGAFLVTRGELYNDLGGFDEAYFMYCEDTDLCRRARLEGYTCVYLHTAAAVHGHARSSAGDLRPQMVLEHNRSRYRYIMIAYGRDAAARARSAMLRGCRLRIALWSALSAVLMRQDAARKAAGYREVLRGTLDLGRGDLDLS